MFDHIFCRISSARWRSNRATASGASGPAADDVRACVDIGAPAQIAALASFGSSGAAGVRGECPPREVEVRPSEKASSASAP